MENDPDAQARIKKSCELLDVKEGMTVLDVGCHKQEARNYLPENIRYCGIDVDKNHVKTVVADIDGGFSIKEKVDRILCLEVLEHLEIPGGTLQSIASNLKDDGIAVISLPNEATLFHRLRCLFGIVDQECFQYGGKHLHLPSLGQSRAFLKQYFVIEDQSFYISQKAIGSKQKMLRVMLKFFPKALLYLLAKVLPSLFARGFIFKLRKKC